MQLMKKNICRLLLLPGDNAIALYARGIDVTDVGINLNLKKC
jgi:hypothetical protein